MTAGTGGLPNGWPGPWRQRGRGALLRYAIPARRRCVGLDALRSDCQCKVVEDLPELVVVVDGPGPGSYLGRGVLPPAGELAAAGPRHPGPGQPRRPRRSRSGSCSATSWASQPAPSARPGC
jgi:hypothetical protein